MPVEISVPFRVADDGSIATETNPDIQIGQQVRSLIGTEPGERVMLPDYGIPLSGVLFEPDDQLVGQEMAQMVANGLALYAPGVVVKSVTPVPTPDGYGIATVNVQFTRSEAPDTNPALSRSINTALVSAGGEVREVIRG
jgi:phage baseplate assembly protein W